MKVSIVIPARLASTRLPRKVLADIHGKPLVAHVWERAIQAACADEVLIATDSQEVLAAAEAWGARAVMTSLACRSGTDRIASILDQLAGDLILNVQGDEPFLDPALLDRLAQVFQETRADLVTPVYPIDRLEELTNPSIVKVVRTADGRALYFSRSPIPYVRDLPQARWLERQIFWGHIGVYGFRREVLACYPTLPASPLEAAEQLEQLRFLEAGFQIRTVQTDYRPAAVDTWEDLQKVREILGEKQ